jgi:hypothetical protein
MVIGTDQKSLVVFQGETPDFQRVTEVISVYGFRISGEAADAVFRRFGVVCPTGARRYRR